MPPQLRYQGTPLAASINSSSSNEAIHSKSPVDTPKEIIKNSPYSDVDAKHHDIFNLVALVGIVALNYLNWDWTLILSGKGGIEESWTGTWYNEFSLYTAAYFALDFLWVTFRPSCVKSPITIQMHHLAMSILIVPFFLPKMRCLMGVGLSVEINTWLLIFRRYLFKNEICVPAALHTTLSLMFHLTWIVVRIILYPMLMVVVARVAIDNYIFWDPPFHHETILSSWALAGWFGIVLLNLKWSVNLFLPMITGKKRKGKGGNTLNRGL